MVDESKVVDGLLRCYERKAELWRKMGQIDMEIKDLRGMVSEKLLKEKGI